MSCAFASRRDAQYFRIRSATALRYSSLNASSRLPTTAAGATKPSSPTWVAIMTSTAKQMKAFQPLQFLQDVLPCQGAGGDHGGHAGQRRRGGVDAQRSVEDPQRQEGIRTRPAGATPSRDLGSVAAAARTPATPGYG